MFTPVPSPPTRASTERIDMRIEKTASVEFKVLKKRFTNDPKRPAAHSAAVAEQVLVAYGILDTENMKKVMVVYNTNTAAAQCRLYKDFSNIDLNGHVFLWQVTFRTALLSFRSAALRRAQQVKLQYVHRTYSSLNEYVPQRERDRFKTVIDISLTGVATINPNFQTAIDNAIDEARTRINNANPAPNPHQVQNRARLAARRR